VRATQPVVPPGLRSRVLDASRRARAAGEPVPAVPAISPAEAFSRAADALYDTLSALHISDWARPAIRDLDVQGLVGHLTGVEHDVQCCLAGDPAVSQAGHVESTQAAATRQAGRQPAQTRDEWQDAVRRTLALVATGGRDLDETVALHGMRLPLHALLVVRAFELWVHENDIRLASGLPLAVPDPSVLSLMTRLAARLLPGAAVRAGVPGPGRLHLVLTGPGGGAWDLEWDPEWDPETASTARPDPAEVGIVADAVGFCRLVSDRMTPAELDPCITGDRDQAAGVLTAAATLALDLPELSLPPGDLSPHPAAYISQKRRGGAKFTRGVRQHECARHHHSQRRHREVPPVADRAGG
jgi:uncharacterized protein (TIGR03083 family)